MTAQRRLRTIKNFGMAIRFLLISPLFIGLLNRVPTCARKISAYTVCKPHADTLHISDFLCDPKIDRTGESLWQTLRRAAYERGFARLSVEFFGSPTVHQKLDAAGFVVRGHPPLYAAISEKWDSFE